MLKPPPVDVFPFRHAYQISEDGRIIYKGQVIHRAFKLAVEPGDRLILKVLRRSSGPEQALQLYGHNCRIKIRRGVSPHGVIWLSLWQEPIEIEFVDVEPEARFSMWNTLGETVGGPTEDSWGNFGAIIEEKTPESEWVLRCCQSPGGTPPDFDALVLQVTRTTNPTP